MSIDGICIKAIINFTFAFSTSTRSRRLNTFSFDMKNMHQTSVATWLREQMFTKLCMGTYRPN